MATPIKPSIATKSNYAVRPSVPSSQKQSADEFNLLVSAVRANYERLILNWDTDIGVNDTLPVGQYVLNDGAVYIITTSYNVGSPITWDDAKATVVIEPSVNHFKGTYTSEGALTSAHPTADEGDYAYVDTGSVDASLYIWDDTDSVWVESGVTTVVPDADASTKGILKLFTTTDGTATDGAPSQAAVNAKFRSTRTVTGADAIVQSDDNSLIIFNSATPFNFTLDQLTANSKISFINIGAGAVTFVAGSGVTVSGSAILTASAGTAYPTAIVFYHTATTPRAITGGNGGQLIPMDITIDTGPSPDELTLACAGAEDVVFAVTSAATADFTLIFSGHEFTQRITLLLNVNGTVAIACPSGTSGQPNIVGEEADLRYTSKTLTLITTAEKSHIITFLRKTSGTTGVMMMTLSLPISVS